MKRRRKPLSFASYLRKSDVFFKTFTKDLTRKTVLCKQGFKATACFPSNEVCLQTIFLKSMKRMGKTLRCDGDRI